MTDYPIGISGLTLTGYLRASGTPAATFAVSEAGASGSYYKDGDLSETPAAGLYALELRTDSSEGPLYWQDTVYVDATGAFVTQTGDAYAIISPLISAGAFTAGALVNAPVTSVTGPGADRCTQTWNNSTTGQPVENGELWVTTDEAGSFVYEGPHTTNSLGKALFMLDAGNPYYMWGQKSGVNPIRGVLFTAEADPE